MNRHRRRNTTTSCLPRDLRRWLYGIAAAGAPIAMAYGLITEEQGFLWLNLVGSILLTVAATNTPESAEQPAREDQE